MAIADIQQQAGQSNDPFACPDLFTPTFSNVTGDFQVTVTSVGYWNGSTFAVRLYCRCRPAVHVDHLYIVIVQLHHGGDDRHHRSGCSPAAQRQQHSRTSSHGCNSRPVVRLTHRCPLSLRSLSKTARGDIVTSDFSSVTLNLVSGPNGGTISSTCSGVESYGIVQFTDCSMNTQGSYGIQAVDGSLVPTTVANVSVTGATATKLAFTSNALTGTASGSASLGPITVQEEDAYGDPVPTTTPVTVTLSSSSTGTNEFAAASGGAAITSVTIPANSSSATFYYGDTKAGSPTLTASAAGLGVRDPVRDDHRDDSLPSSPSRAARSARARAVLPQLRSPSLSRTPTATRPRRPAPSRST